MDTDKLFAIYLSTLVLSVLLGISRLKRVDRASRVIVLVLGSTLASEIAAYLFAKTYGNNMAVYHFFNPIELFLIAAYFNFSIEQFSKNRIGFLLGAAGLIVGLFNTLTFQPLHTLNSNFLLFEGFCIIAMSLFSFRQMFDNDRMAIARNPHFWFSCIFLFSYGVTYTNWSVYSFLGQNMINVIPFVSVALLTVGCISNLGFGIVFILYPKTSTHE